MNDVRLMESRNWHSIGFEKGQPVSPLFRMSGTPDAIWARHGSHLLVLTERFIVFQDMYDKLWIYVVIDD